MTVRPIAVCACLVALSFTPQRAVAQSPPYGPDCRDVVARGRGHVWIGTIRGQREDIWDATETRFQRSCFPTRTACERWLYAARSYYTLNFDNDACRPAR